MHCRERFLCPVFVGDVEINHGLISSYSYMAVNVMLTTEFGGR